MKAAPPPAIATITDETATKTIRPKNILLMFLVYLAAELLLFSLLIAKKLNQSPKQKTTLRMLSMLQAYFQEFPYMFIAQGIVHHTPRFALSDQTEYSQYPEML